MGRTKVVPDTEIYGHESKKDLNPDPFTYRCPNKDSNSVFNGSETPDNQRNEDPFTSRVWMLVEKIGSFTRYSIQEGSTSLSIGNL